MPPSYSPEDPARNFLEGLEVVPADRAAWNRQGRPATTHNSLSSQRFNSVRIAEHPEARRAGRSDQFATEKIASNLDHFKI